MSVDLGQLEERRNNFYRDSYRKLLNVLVLLLWVGIVLAIALGVMVYAPQQPKYYASTTTGNVTPLFPLSEPVVTDNFILKWSSLVALGVFNLNFNQVDTQLDKQKTKFTADGWNALTGALKSSGFLTSVEQNKLISSAVVDGAPVIVTRAIISGRFSWVIQLPVLISFSSASQNAQEKMILTITVMRVPVLGAPQGIQVTNFSAERKF